ncbi:MAG: fumarylacetoacetate hydrolase family protein [Marinagarivorans sp.]|nr:fumarylacetoacetate hydrolase family protein [Marinagarivorans sp.]
MTNTLPNDCLDFNGNNPSLTYFRVRRIICIGRNYSEHAKEMGHDPEREAPFFFYKPLTSLFPVSPNNAQSRAWSMPHYSQNVHHELEVAIAIGGKVTGNNPEQRIIGAGIALDMTCRDVQQQAKALKQPWATAKGFDHAAPVSPLFETDWIKLQQIGDFTLTKNGHEVQRGNIAQMIWPIPALLLELSRFTQLDKGDLILTGTPAGVSAVNKGDVLRAAISQQNCALEIEIN